MSAQMIDQMHKVYDLFIEATGVSDIRQLRQEHLARFIDVLNQLPKSYRKSPKDRLKTLAQILDAAQGNPHVSRSGLDRCLRRHGAGNLRALKPKEPKPAHGTFKAYEPGYLHIDIKYLPQMADEDRRRYLFVAIDRATRWVFVRIYPAQTAANARRFLRDLERAAPMKITRVLTDNGKAFTDRLFGLRKRAATGQHEFDLLCADFGIEHRLAPPMRPQTNGMVERFNGRIEDILQSHRFHSGEDLEQTLLRYAHLYNNQLPQSVLKGRSPINALKDWQRQRPELFRKRVYNHANRTKQRRLSTLP